jgi:hypothetical protein
MRPYRSAWAGPHTPSAANVLRCPVIMNAQLEQIVSEQVLRRGA